jgi:DNA invertase Pin-like site-specific DNA recombinase
MEGRFVAYYRVSTDKQGKSGLGLEAQKEKIMRYLNGGGWELVGEYTEIESGGKDDRPQLAKAISDCRLKGARLLVAKLDRLSRDLGFIVALQKSDIEFTVAEMPDATEKTINIYATMGQHERKVISQRTKDALAAAKALGKKLGSPLIVPGISQIPGSGDTTNARQVHVEKSSAFGQAIMGKIHQAREESCSSMRQIAEWLNKDKCLTRRGKEWSGAGVHQLIKRIEQ